MAGVTVAELIERLEDLKKNGPTHPTYGVCHNATIGLDTKYPPKCVYYLESTLVYKLFEALAKEWPKLGKNISAYPIAGFGERIKDMWSEHGNLKRRHEYIDYLIEELKAGRGDLDKIRSQMEADYANRTY